MKNFKLYIPEKPSTAKALARALGIPALKGKGKCFATDEAAIVPAMGHLFELFEPEDYDKRLKKWSEDTLPFAPPGEFKIKLTNQAHIKKQFALIKKYYPKATQIIHAGDSDREGQYLIDEILDYLDNKKPVLRFFPKSTSKQGVLKSLSKMKDNHLFIDGTYAAMARNWSDYLIGLNVTRALTIAAQNAGLDLLLSAGRVQTIIVTLVVDRDREIETFVPLDYFVPKITLEHPNGNFEATWVPNDAHPLDPENRLVKKEYAQSIIGGIEGQAGIILLAETKTKTKEPPLPYTQGGLLKEASLKYGIGAQATADLAQAIYLKGLITYPRTDNKHLDEADFEDGVKTLKRLASYGIEAAKNADPTIKSKAWKPAKETDNKYAIIPTGEQPRDLKPIEQKIYDMIATRYIMQFYPTMAYESQKIITELAGEKWETTGTRVINPGWTVLQGKKAQDDNLPKVNQNDPVACIAATILTKTTKPPALFTTGTLADALEDIHKYVTDPRVKAILRENAGIGTDGTRPNRINLTMERNYIKKAKAKGDQVTSTKLGRFIRDNVHESLTEPATSAMWDEFLNLIADGEQTKENFIAQVKAQLPILVKQSLNIKFPKELVGVVQHCPECNAAMRRYKRKKGKGFFWGCFKKENHADGEAIMFKDAKGRPGEKIVPFDINSLPHAPCPEAGCTEQTTLRKSEKGFEYWKCNNKDHPLRFNDDGKPGEVIEFGKKKAS